MIVFGTRPEAIKMAPIIKSMAKFESMSPILVSTGQHKEMLEQVLAEFDLLDRIDYDLELMQPQQTLSSLSALAITKLDAVISEIRPDLVLVQGDTTTAYMAALTAFYWKVDVAHVEAGLRTYNIYSPFPEEINRQSISAIAKLNFAPTEYAAQKLLEERRNNVHVTGNTVVDALFDILDREISPAMIDLKILTKKSCDTQNPKLLLLTAHRRENLGHPLKEIFTAVSLLLVARQDVVVVYPIHLNPQVKVAAEEIFGKCFVRHLHSRKKALYGEGAEHLKRLLLIPPLDHSDLVRVMQWSTFVLTDSGGIQEEAITLGKPVVILRDTTERLEGVRAGVSKLVGWSKDKILDLSQKLLDDPAVYQNMSSGREIFGNGTSAEQIVRIIEHHLHNKSNKLLLPE